MTAQAAWREQAWRSATVPILTRRWREASKKQKAAPRRCGYRIGMKAMARRHRMSCLARHGRGIKAAKNANGIAA